MSLFLDISGYTTKHPLLQMRLLEPSFAREIFCCLRSTGSCCLALRLAHQRRWKS